MAMEREREFEGNDRLVKPSSRSSTVIMIMKVVLLIKVVAALEVPMVVVVIVQAL